MNRATIKGIQLQIPVMRNKMLALTRGRQPSRSLQTTEMRKDIDSSAKFAGSEASAVGVARSDAKMAILQPSTKAPDFAGKAVVDGIIKDISLSDYTGKYVVLLFYPADFTFVCPTEIIAFSDRVEEFRREGCEVVAVSTDSEFVHMAWVNTPRENGGLGKMKIPLLADRTQQISSSYGVLNTDLGVAYRGLFIIDKDGVLRQITINDLPVGRDVDETLRLVHAFKFTDEFGEVCPAGWKKGKMAMKPTKEGVSKYLSTLAMEA